MPLRVGLLGLYVIMLQRTSLITEYTFFLPFFFSSSRRVEEGDREAAAGLRAAEPQDVSRRWGF